MAAKVRFGLVGAGGIAQAHAQAFRAAEHAELVAIADPRAEAAQTLAESGGWHAYASYQEMAEKEKLDAVVIATPPDTHMEISLFFVDRGKHVLCEKPLSVELASARRMLDAASSARVLLTMGSKFRHSEDVVSAKAILASGALGEVIRLENTFTSRVDMTSRWNSRRSVGGGGVLIDNGTHSADIMRFVAGPITKVFATEATRLQKMEVEDTVHVTCRSVSGVLGTFDLTWSANSFAPDYLKVWGSSGTLCVGWGESRYKTFNSSEWVVFGKGYNKVQGLHAQLENFSRTIRGEATLLIDAEDVLASVHVIEACYQSIGSGGWVDVNGRPERRTAPRPVETAR